VPLYAMIEEDAPRPGTVVVAQALWTLLLYRIEESSTAGRALDMKNLTGFGKGRGRGPLAAVAPSPANVLVT